MNPWTKHAAPLALSMCTVLAATQAVPAMSDHQPVGGPPLVSLRDAPQEQWKVNSEAVAIELAWRYTAGESQAAAKAVAALVKLDTEDSPYLYRALAGRQVWRVTMTHVNLDPDAKSTEPPAAPGSPTPAPKDTKDVAPSSTQPSSSSPAGSDVAPARPEQGRGPQFFRDLYAYIDPVTGGLLKVVTNDRQDEERQYLAPTGESATQQLYNWGIEQWWTVLDDPPQVNLAQALRSIRKQGWQTFEAQEIVAHAVIYSENLKPQRAVWSVHTRGITPIMPDRERSVSPKARNHIRHIVDAKTAALVGSGTTPQPADPPKAKTEPLK